MADEKKTNPPIPPAGGASAPDAKKPDGEKADATAAPAAKAAGASSAWLPVLVVIIITPILSFVMTENVMIPRVKKALGEIAKIQQEAAQPAAGGPLPTEHKAPSKAGHGGGHGSKEGKEGKEGEAGVKFENIVGNLSGSMKSRFLKISFMIEGDDEGFKETINENKTKIIDSTLGIISGLSVTDLDDPGSKNIVRSNMIDSFNQVLSKPLVKRLYFSEFVIQ